MTPQGLRYCYIFEKFINLQSFTVKHSLEPAYSILSIALDNYDNGGNIEKFLSDLENAEREILRLR